MPKRNRAPAQARVYGTGEKMALVALMSRGGPCPLDRGEIYHASAELARLDISRGYAEPAPHGEIDA